MKNLLFLCIASAIVIFNVIVINVAPIIKGDLESMSDTSCSYYADYHKYYKEKAWTYFSTLGVSSDKEKEEYFDLVKEEKDKCYRHKAMTGLEYSSLSINITFGFICAILGLLQYLNAGNNIGKIVGIIGLATGIIGFVLTLVYVIYSGIIFTQEVPGKKLTRLNSIYSNVYPKGESDGSVLKWDGGKYKCIFYKEGNKDSVFIKYSDYGKNYLNYYKKREFGPEDDDYEVSRCSASISSIPLEGNSVNNLWDICKLLDDGTIKLDSKMEYHDNDGKKVGDCDKIRVQDTNLPYDSNEYRNIYDHWVTSIVFSCLIIVLEIGLAIFGFLLFKDSNGKGTPL